MGTYGLKVWDSSGNLTLDTSDRITRFRYSTIALANVDGSINLPDIAGKNTVQFGQPLNGSTLWQCPHGVTRSGTTIYWTHRHMGLATSTDTLVIVFVYD